VISDLPAPLEALDHAAVTGGGVDVTEPAVREPLDEKTVAMVYESGTAPLTLLTADGQATRPDLGGDADPVASFTAEIQAAVDGVGAGREPDLLSAQLARDALVLCQKECQSVLSGHAVAV